MIDVEAGAAADGGHPFVIVRWGGEEGQLTPGDAAQLAFQLLESSIEAERDAGFMKFLRSMDFSMPEAGAMLKGLRDHRQQHRVDGFDQEGQL